MKKTFLPYLLSSFVALTVGVQSASAATRLSFHAIISDLFDYGLNLAGLNGGENISKTCNATPWKLYCNREDFVEIVIPSNEGADFNTYYNVEVLPIRKILNRSGGITATKEQQLKYMACIYTNEDNMNNAVSCGNEYLDPYDRRVINDAIAEILKQRNNQIQQEKAARYGDICHERKHAAESKWVWKNSAGDLTCAAQKCNLGYKLATYSDGRSKGICIEDDAVVIANPVSEPTMTETTNVKPAPTMTGDRLVTSDDFKTLGLKDSTEMQLAEACVANKYTLSQCQDMLNQYRVNNNQSRSGQKQLCEDTKGTWTINKCHCPDYYIFDSDQGCMFDRAAAEKKQKELSQTAEEKEFQAILDSLNKEPEDPSRKEQKNNEEKAKYDRMMEQLNNSGLTGEQYYEAKKKIDAEYMPKADKKTQKEAAKEADKIAKQQEAAKKQADELLKQSQEAAFNKRVDGWLKDHPGKNRKEAEEAIKLEDLLAGN